MPVNDALTLLGRPPALVREVFAPAAARLLRLLTAAMALIGFWLVGTYPAPALANAKPTTLIILGVNHGGELVDPEQNPGRYRAYFDAVKPDVFLIEREPERAALANWYPFTYEQQDIVVPYARDHGIPVIPIDWLPPETDSLALGYPSLSIAPPFMKRGGGFQDLLTFPSEDYGLGFFFAEDQAYREKVFKWAYHPQPSGRDYGRRLYLYRTLMMALHIDAVARQFPGKRILLVVGWMHKPDLEGLLSKPQTADAVQLTVQPSSSIAAAAVEDSYKYLTARDCSAIYSVNLISGAVPTRDLELGWLKEISRTCGTLLPRQEFAFFSDYLTRASGALTKAQLATRLRALRASVPPNTPFTWSASAGDDRLETAYDPFGTLDLHQRILLGIVQLDGSFRGNRFSVAGRDEALYQELLDSLSFVKRRQLIGYLAWGPR